MARGCSVPDCPNPHKANGWCGKHNRKWVKYGDPLVSQRQTQKGMICSVTDPDCRNPAYSRGWCNKHYLSWQTHGDPVGGKTVRQRRMTLEEFTIWFWKQLIVRDSGCWEWRHSTNRKGYGTVNARILLKTSGAHKVAWMLANGVTKMPEGEPYVLHSCRNPPCCRPEHLRPGTQQENMKDMVRDGTQTSQLTNEQVLSIRQEYSAGGITQKALGEKYGIKQESVSGIVRRKTWRHI